MSSSLPSCPVLGQHSCGSSAVCSHLEVAPLAKPRFPLRAGVVKYRVAVLPVACSQNLCTKALFISLQSLLPMLSQRPSWTPEHTDWPGEASTTNKAAVWLDPCSLGGHLSAVGRGVSSLSGGLPPVCSLALHSCEFTASSLAPPLPAPALEPWDPTAPLAFVGCCL